MTQARAEVVVSAKDEATAVLRAISGEVGSVVSTFTGIAGAIGGLGVGALAAFTSNAISSAAALDDLAEVTGASVEELSKLEQVAVISGVAMEDVAAASVKLTKSLGEAEDPASAAAKALASIGLTAKDLKGLDTAQQMQRVAQALGGFGDGAGKTSVALALLGKSGAQLLPYLKDLAEAGELNATLTGEQAAAAEQYEKASKRLNLELNKLGKQLANESIPVLTALKKAAIDTATSILGIGENASELDRSNAIKTFAENAGLAIAFIGDAADGVVRTFQVLGTVIGGVAALPVGNWEGVKRGLKDIGEQVDGILIRETLSERFKREFAKIKAGAESAGKTIKEQITFNGQPDGKDKKEEIDDARQALARYVAELQKEADKLAEITEQERARRLLAANPSIDTAQVRELLKTELAIVDARQRAAAARKEDAESERQLIAQMRSMDDQLASFSGRADEARKIALTARLEARLAAGEMFSKEELEKMVKGIGGIREEVEKTKGVAEELGLVFASSLGRFLENPSGGANAFFKALAQDVQKLIVQLLIVKPLAQEIEKIFGKGSGGSGGGASWLSGALSAAGNFIFGGGGGGGTGQNANGSWGFVDSGRATITNVYIDGAIDRARIASYVETGVKAGLAQSWDSVARGGSGVLAG